MSQVSSLYFYANNERPLWRGKIHEYAFYVTLVSLLISLLLLNNWRNHFVPLIVYFCSILCQYGISGYYNQQIWKCPTTELKWQRLDHSCIYLLISGTYTAQICIVWDDMGSGRSLLIIIWVLAILGVLKTICLTAMPTFINTLLYICIGCACLPWIGSIASSVSALDLILVILGGVFYIVGGLIFAFKRPDPFPQTFGSHEIFHVCTVLAQICFFIPIAVAL